MDNIRTDVIIPVYRPTEKFLRLLEMLDRQTQAVEKIIVVNTEKAFWDAFPGTKGLQDRYPGLTVFHIAKQEFDHAGTRNFGVQQSESPFFVMMTDDAIPADTHLIQRLLEPFSDEKVGMSYARQLPAEDCGVIERYTRKFNYPEYKVTKTKEDLDRLGIKTFFASNVCAAYRREYFDRLGGFEEPAIFNEDMIYARHLIDAGYSITYAADACVAHSHNYSGRQQFHRNFDLGVSHAQHPEVFGDISAQSEGIRLVKETAGYLCRIKKPYLVVRLIWQSGCKYLGYLLGKHYQQLPRALVKRCSMNRNYFLK